MKKPSIFKVIARYFKRFVAWATWSLFLWASDTTEEQYWTDIYNQEKQRIDYPELSDPDWWREEAKKYQD